MKLTMKFIAVLFLSFSLFACSSDDDSGSGSSSQTL